MLECSEGCCERCACRSLLWRDDTIMRHREEGGGRGRRGGISLGGEMKLAWSEKVRRRRKERDGWGGDWGRRVRRKPVRERVTRCAILSFTGRWCCVTSLQWHCHLPCHCDTTLTWVNLCDIIQGVFFNWTSPLDCPPPKFALTGPPLNFLSVGIIFTSPDT